MLKRDKLILAIFPLLFFACSENKNEIFRKKSEAVVSAFEYKKVYQVAVDSITQRQEAGIKEYIEIKNENEYILDSLLCFNENKDRFISCLLGRTLLKGASMDGLAYFYGEKINSKWYFFNGPSIVVPRSMVEGHNVAQPLSFEQLHEIALKEVYSPYLTSAGEINEAWFIQQFENAGMCSTCKTREDFQKNIIEGSAAVWARRDTTQAIKRLEKTKTVLP